MRKPLFYSPQSEYLAMENEGTGNRISPLGPGNVIHGGLLCNTALAQPFRRRLFYIFIIPNKAGQAEHFQNQQPFSLWC